MPNKIAVMLDGGRVRVHARKAGRTYDPAYVIAMVLGFAARLLAAGVALGLGASLASVKLLSGLVHNVSTFDPYSFAAVAVLLFAAGIFASFWPARRAARVDPITALRDQ
jgi:putative ABC transport system permease protein